MALVIKFVTLASSSPRLTVLSMRSKLSSQTQGSLGKGSLVIVVVVVVVVVVIVVDDVVVLHHSFLISIQPNINTACSALILKTSSQPL